MTRSNRGARLIPIFKPSLPVAVLWFALTLSSAANPPSSSERLAQALDPNHPRVLVAAHRGGYESDREDNAPENSITNVEVAIRRGYDVYETDIQRTADGVFVIVHDPTLDRETNGSGSVAELTFKELRALKKRFRDGTVSDQSVATLEELLLAGKDRILFKPDLKPGVMEHFDELARLIGKLGMQEQVFLRTAAKDAAVIQTLFKEGTPRVEVMFKLGNRNEIRQIHADFRPRTVEVKFGKGETLSAVKRAAISEATSLGILVEAHSYNDPKQWEALAEAGVRMFHTAAPEKTLRFLRENGWRGKQESP